MAGRRSTLCYKAYLGQEAQWEKGSEGTACLSHVYLLVTSFKGIRSKSVEPVSLIMYEKGFVDLVKKFEWGILLYYLCVCALNE